MKKIFNKAKGILKESLEFYGRVITLANAPYIQ